MTTQSSAGAGPDRRGAAAAGHARCARARATARTVDVAKHLEGSAVALTLRLAEAVELSLHHAEVGVLVRMNVADRL